MIGGDFFAEWPGVTALTSALEVQLSDAADYEAQLDTARRWAKEWHFRIGVHLLRGLMDSAQAGRAYADLAEASLAAVWPVVAAHFALKHGPAPGRGAVVLGMGSLGAGRLHARSDLDLIVIYDAQNAETSEGPRPLAARTYYARLTQALITAVTAPMSEGRLYEVDMRLRPSGNKGPVATSWASFRNYQTSEAWVWEHLALTRARAVAGAQELAADIEAFRQDLLSARRPHSEVLGEVCKMRQRIADAKGNADFWDPKLGRGRMQDIELLAQAGALLAADTPGDVPGGVMEGVKAGWMSQSDGDHLCATYQLAWALQIGARLIRDSALRVDELGDEGAAFLLRETDAPDMEVLASRLDDWSRKSADIIDKIVGQGAEK